MFLIAFILISTFIFVRGQDGYCPPGAANLNNICYTFSLAPFSFFDAQFHCNNQNGTLAVIDSAFSNNHIAEMAGKQWVDFWIGAKSNLLEVDVGKVKIWTWDGLDKFLTFNEWDINEPSNKGDCATVKTSNGRWFAEDCSIKRNFVCSIPMQIDVCESEWMYFAPTKFCYKVLYHSEWNSAENNCVLLKGHLVSIHSDIENRFVQDIAQNGIAVDSWLKTTYIGLYTKTNDNSIWNWTDGSPVDYSPPWLSGEPNGPGVEKCVLMTTDPYDTVLAGYWGNYVCDAQLRNYVCKKQPKQIPIQR